MKVYILLEDLENPYSKEDIIIGVYASQESAEKARKQFKENSPYSSISLEEHCIEP